MPNQLSFPQKHNMQLAHNMRFIQPFLNILKTHKYSKSTKPFITLSYAQSIDGSISLDPKTPLALSHNASLKMTHILRAHHDALLIGINTTLVDDPQLNVRYADGEDPQPVILDCMLRFPENAKMLTASSKLPIIIAAAQAPAEKKCRLEAKGIRVLTVKQTSDGHVDLFASLKLLPELGLKTIMVEGGAQVINEFYKRRLVDYCFITVSPKIIGGLKAVNNLCRPPLEIKDCQFQPLESDFILYGAVAK